ncbi:MAG: hypothetical protein KBC73_13205 [Burkholderiaceae bacterium]|nr:hypothetical protein [Burkholderiaceae bacterium]
MGLTSQQVDQLETEALPAAANYLHGLDRTDEVRIWLKKFKHASRKPGRQLDSLLTQATAEAPPSGLTGAMRRIAVAAYGQARRDGAPFAPGFVGDDGPARVRQIASAPERLAAIVDAALAIGMPAQRRRDSGLGAVSAIWEVVQHMGIQLQSAPASPMCQIALFCFEVLQPGRFDSGANGPERALKALIQREKKEASQG